MEPTAVLDAVLALAGSPVVLGLVFLFCVIDGVLPVLPSETLIVALAALTAAGGGPALLPLGVAGAAGAFLGDLIAYGVGGRIAVDRIRSTRLRRLVHRAQGGIRARPVQLILLARYIPIGRVAVNLAAGATRIGLRRFALIEACSCPVWALYSIGLGTLGGQWAGRNHLLAVGLAILLAVVAAVLIEIGVRIARRLRAPQG